MKHKIRLLNVATATAAAMTPVCVFASCGPNRMKATSTIEKDTIEEFKKLTVIPHSSDPFLKEVPYEQGNVWNLSCYLKDRISKIIGKNVFQDKYGNIVFDVPANTKALENAPKIAIQAHMDMVFAYDPNKIEFKPDPRIWKIALVEDTDENGKRILHSDKYRTSIGADNGMGVAQILALIQHNEIKHGNLRFILTNCEENGSQGGSLLFNETYPNVLKDFYYVINLDGEDIGDVCVACSGAVGSYYYFNSDSSKSTLSYVPQSAADNNFYKIAIAGFPGGHSGVDIKLRRDNALQFTNCILEALNGTTVGDNHLRLYSISTPGCTVYNAIPDACEVVICSDSWKKTKTLDEVTTLVQQTFDDVVAERKSFDRPIGDKRDYDKQFDAAQYDKVTLKVTQEKPKYDFALNVADTANLFNLQNESCLPYGIKKWPTDAEMAQLTGDQTSSNIGPAEGKLTSNLTFEYKLSTYSRSSDSNDVANFFKANEVEAKSHGATWKYDAKFEPWHVDNNTKLFDLCKKGWIKAGVDESKVKASRTHGGLECSFWHEAMEMDETKVGKTAIVSYGPQLHDVHKFTETVELDSVKTCVYTTIYILEHANELIIN